MPTFTKNELIDWLLKNGVESKWITYVESGYDKDLKPSIDRISDWDGYSFDNMRLVTWRVNRVKGYGCEKFLANFKPYRKPVKLIDSNGIEVARFKSVRDCGKFLNVHELSVTRALTGKRKSIKKHTVKYLTGTELEFKL